MGYMGVPFEIVNETCDHNRKATIISKTDQEIFRPQLKVLIKKLLIYMGFFSFSKFLLISNMVPLCALKVRLLEYEKIQKMNVFI